MSRKKRKAHSDPEADFLRAQSIFDTHDAEHHNINRAKNAQLKRARQLLYRSATAGHVQSQWALALCYFSGTGIKPDSQRFVSWGSLATKNGHEEAPAKLGVFLYEKGIFSEALPYLRKGGERGYAECYFSLGDCYQNGKGVPRDYLEAVKCYKLAGASDMVADPADYRLKSWKAVLEIRQLVVGLDIIQKDAIIKTANEILYSSAKASADQAPSGNIVPASVLDQRRLAVQRAAQRPNQIQPVAANSAETKPNSGGFD